MSYSFLDIIYKVNQMIKANLSPQQVDQTIINTFLGPKNSQTKETQEAPALKSEFRISNIPQFNNLIISSQQRSLHCWRACQNTFMDKSRHLHTSAKSLEVPDVPKEKEDDISSKYFQ